MVFFNQFRNYIIFFIIFGLWSTWPNTHIKWLLRIYSNLLIATVFCSYLSAVFMNQFFESLSLSTSIATAAFITIISAHLVIAIETPFKSKTQVVLIRKFSVVDQLFSSRWGVAKTYPEEKRKVFFLNVGLILIIVFIKAVLLIYACSQDRMFNFMYSSIYSSWIMQLRSIQVLFFVHLVQNRLTLINIELVNIRNECNFPGNPRDRNVKPVFTHVNVMSGKLSIHDRLIVLKQIYGELYKICTLINTIFGWSLLAIITQNSIDFTINGYWLFQVYNSESPDYVALIICTILLITNAIILSVLTYFCSSCFKQVRTNAHFRTKTHK